MSYVDCGLMFDDGRFRKNFLDYMCKWMDQTKRIYKELQQEIVKNRIKRILNFFKLELNNHHSSQLL